jgi:hypothetical protein
MPTYEQEIEAFTRQVQFLLRENEALVRICTDQARMIRHYRDSLSGEYGHVGHKTLDLREPEAS